MLLALSRAGMSPTLLLLGVVLLLCTATAWELRLTRKTISDKDKAGILKSKSNADAFNKYMRLYDDLTPEVVLGSAKPKEMNKIVDGVKKNFVKNLKSIQAHNKQYKKGKYSFEMTVNSFTAMSSNQRLKYLGVANVTKVNSKYLTRDKLSNKGLSAPSDLSWYSKGMMTGVKNQGSCGSCWTFPAVALLEFAYKKITGSMLQFSEQELLDCTYEGQNYNGCGGGWYHQSWAWIIRNKHLASLRDYPYNARDGRCSYTSYTNRIGDILKLKSYTKITPKDETGVIRAIQVMPLAVAFYVEDRFFSVGNGIFDGCYRYQPSNHAVTLVGYAAGYWQIKNSWGGDWGARGYGRFKRRGDICNLLSDVYYISYDSIYDGDTIDPEDCTDTDERCATYPASYCKGQYAEWMGENCKALCGMCEETTDPTDGNDGCKDLNTDCGAWEQLGYCKTYKLWMGDNCQKACGTCGEDSKCLDSNNQCSGWANDGYCSNALYSTYMTTNCKKSCVSSSSCDDDGSGNSCEDKDTSGNCGSWAGSGYCKSGTYVEYMKSDCKKSCGLCKGGGGGGGCTGGLVKCSDGVCRHKHMC